MRALAALMLVLAMAAGSGWYWIAAPQPASLVVAGPCTPATGPELVWVPGGSFTMGAEYAYPEEGPAHQQTLPGFWMARTEVTNDQFAGFVAATGYQTLAERGISDPADPGKEALPGSAVFAPVFNKGELDPFAGWWHFRAGANWRHPEGPGSGLDGRGHHPVVHVAWEDALAYASWKGHSLPTETQFEFAARGEGRKNAAGAFSANTWQGFFPFHNDPLDGYTGTAPAGCFGANALGLHDLIGNVWEWTASPYYPAHGFSASGDWPEGLDPAQPGEAVAVIKGGSFLCAPNYCMRYRPEARQGQSKGLGTSHIGFRTVVNP